ncbi:MAG TPA: L-seryl-tRNA(Sec) selenium transferase, partial [Eubacteriaceae bacterium]|nr:L-seryl-tRNA(Sec) selenium transferase [Eubacteriaceae bacterium]
VEIGGSFRIPEIIEQSGCIMKEVGTTNKTYASDYEKAMNENTAVVLKVHTSNYKIEG